MRKVASPKHPKRRPKDIYSEAEIELLEALPSPDGPLCTLLFARGSARPEPATSTQRHRPEPRAGWPSPRKAPRPGSSRCPPKRSRPSQTSTCSRLCRPILPVVLDPRWPPHIGRRRRSADTTFDNWWTRIAKAPGSEVEPAPDPPHLRQRLRETGRDIESAAGADGPRKHPNHRRPVRPRQRRGRRSRDRRDVVMSARQTPQSDRRFQAVCANFG